MFDRFNNGNASRTRFIVVLLLGALLLASVLAWQAQQATRTHLATATGVLRDYAALAADEYSRRAMGQVGYYGYFLLIGALGQQESPGVTLAEDSLATYVFTLNVSSGDIEIEWGAVPKVSVADAAAALAREQLDGEMSEAGFVVRHATIGAEPHTFVFWRDEAGQVRGFEVSRSALATSLATVFAEFNLLPGALGGGSVTNDSIFVELLDQTGRSLFSVERDFDTYLKTSKLLGDEYGGLFAGHRIDVAIDPAVAESLVIGGLPRSRLPVLIAILALALGLIIAAIRQLQRERALNQLRADFVSEVSHELRTPLTQIKMFTETLLLGRVRDEKERGRSLRIIDRESQRLINLVENILRFSNGKRRSQGLAIENRYLAPIIRRVVEEFRPLADTVSFDIEVDDVIQSPVDEDALRQILLNLLDNAIKYGPKAQTVNVSLRARENRAHLSITDEGPGVPESRREQVFSGYFRLQRERESAIAGAGIGLAVVQDLVTQLEGKVGVHAGPNNGACFVVELPLANAA